MRKPQPLATLAISMIAVVHLACSTPRALGATQSGVSGVGDRGGRWPGGVGAVLRWRERDARLVVHEVPPAGAAARAGLREGDVIEAIDGDTLEGKRRDEVVALLRGEVGTTVRLRVRRDGAEREVTIERAPYRRASE